MRASAYVCPGAHPSFVSYFDSTGSWDLAKWAWTYRTARNGVLTQSSETGYTGDTTG